MSYCIGLEGAECPTCKHSATSDFYWNYTSNMGPAWRAAGADLAEYDGKPAAECSPALDAAIATMEAEPERVAAGPPDADGFVAVLVRGWAKMNAPPRGITADALRARLAILCATDPLPLP